LNLESEKRIILMKRSLSQYKRLDSDRTIYIRAGSEDGETFFGAWAATEIYTPIPHNLLRSSISGALREWGIELKRFEWRDYFKRTGLVFVLGESPLNYRMSDTLSHGVLVTNANTAKDSIRVFPFAEILKCKNGLIGFQYGRRIAIVHKGEKNAILAKVLEAVKEATRLRYGAEIKRGLEELQLQNVSPDELNAWLRVIQPKLPDTHCERLIRNLKESVIQFGGTKLAMVQALTRTGEEVSTNKAVQRFLMERAAEIVEGENR